MTDIDRALEHKSAKTPRQQLLWDVFIFQFKLTADGLRDVVLSPLSIVLAIVGVVAGGDDPYRYYRRLLHLGRESDDWINLFGHQEGDTAE